VVVTVETSLNTAVVVVIDAGDRVIMFYPYALPITM
jgi:hypothetical protein